MWKQHGTPKRWYPTTTLNGVTTQQTSAWLFIAVKWHLSNVKWEFYNCEIWGSHRDDDDDDGGSVDLQNTGFLPLHYTALQPWKQRWQGNCTIITKHFQKPSSELISRLLLFINIWRLYLNCVVQWRTESPNTLVQLCDFCRVVARPKSRPGFKCFMAILATFRWKLVRVLFVNWTPRHEGVLGSGVTAPRIIERNSVLFRVFRT
jgi:hypothetical protein